jgi:hypothetical protein
VAALFKACAVFYRSKTGIVGSNSTLVQYLCCPVWVEALRRADPPSKETYQMSKNKIPKPEKTGGLGPHLSVVPYKKNKMWPMTCDFLIAQSRERALFPDLLRAKGGPLP